MRFHVIDMRGFMDFSFCVPVSEALPDNGDIKADVIAKGTRVDGVYDKDPLKFTEAVQYKEITYLEVLSKALGVMDATSIAMCRDNKLPILVFNLNTAGNIMRMAKGEAIGTIIR